MHLADLRSYLEADHRLTELYADEHAWARKAILNVAGSGKFSSDRTIAICRRDLECQAQSDFIEGTADDRFTTRRQTGTKRNADRSRRS